MRSHARSLAIFVAALCAAGCAPSPVDVDVRFPSLETFLYADSGRLLIYEVDAQDGLGRCPALIDAIVAGGFGQPALDSDWQPICAFRAGGVGFDDVPPGPHAYVALVRDEANALLLHGCRVAEAYDGAPSVSVDLYPTPGYAAATERQTLSCASEIDKCERGCR